MLAAAKPLERSRLRFRLFRRPEAVEAYDAYDGVGGVDCGRGGIGLNALLVVGL